MMTVDAKDVFIYRQDRDGHLPRGRDGWPVPTEAATIRGLVDTFQHRYRLRHVERTESSPL